MGASVDLGGVLLERAPEGLTPYSWRGVCRIPGCRRPATDPHHIVPRGRTGGPLRYLLLDGQVVANIAGLCRRHHDKLTEGRSAFLWREAQWWYQSEVRLVAVLPLDNAGVIAALGGKHCPHCGRPKPRPQPWENRPRERRQVAVIVPNDAAENGAEVLESLSEQVAELMGCDNPHTPGARYFAMTAALAGALQGNGNGVANGHPRSASGTIGAPPTNGALVPPAASVQGAVNDESRPFLTGSQRQPPPKRQ